MWLTRPDVGLPAEITDEMAIPTHTHWNPLIRWLFWRRYEEIADLAELDPSMRVLDFGCGIGVFLPTLCAQAGAVYAVDRFPQYAERLCRQRGLTVRFLEEIDALDEPVDLIVAADVLEHIEALDPLLSRFRASLRADGRLLVSGPTENLAYKLGRTAAGFAGKGDYHLRNIDSLRRDITESGFASGRVRELPFSLPPHLFRICEFSAR